MERSGNGNFERQWRDAFMNESATPDERVWKNIELSLAEKENLLYRKKVRRSRWLVAASLFLAVMAGAAGYYYGTNYSPGDLNSTGNNLADIPVITEPQQKESESTSSNTHKSKTKNNIQQTENVEDRQNEPVNNKENAVNDIAGNQITNQRNAVALIPDNNERDTENTETISAASPEESEIEEVKIPDTIESLGIQYNSLSATAEPGFVPYFIPYIEPEENNQFVWGGLSLAGGSFDPAGRNAASNGNDAVYSLASVNPESANNRLDYYSNEIPGFAQRISINVGGKISKKLSLRSGISVVKYSSGTEISQSGQSYLTSIYSADNALMRSQPDMYLEENNYTYLSVPIEIGYNIVDRKMGWLVTSGIHSSALISFEDKRLSDNYLVFNKSEKEYSSYLFWYLIGTELNYKLGENYVVALAPGYRLALNSHEKNSDIRATSAELGLRMRYNF